MEACWAPYMFRAVLGGVGREGEGPGDHFGKHFGFSAIPATVQSMFVQDDFLMQTRWEPEEQKAELKSIIFKYVPSLLDILCT